MNMVLHFPFGSCTSPGLGPAHCEYAIVQNNFLTKSVAIRECKIMLISFTNSFFKHYTILLQAAVVLGPPIATFPTTPEFRLSALPSTEKERLLEDRSGTYYHALRCSTCHLFIKCTDLLELKIVTTCDMGKVKPLG